MRKECLPFFSQYRIKKDFFVFIRIHAPLPPTTTKFNTLSISYSLPFPVCHAVQNALSELMVCHTTHVFLICSILFLIEHMYGNNEEWKRIKKITRTTAQKCEMNSCIIHLCVAWFCVRFFFISYLLCLRI